MKPFFAYLWFAILADLGECSLAIQMGRFLGIHLSLTAGIDL